MSLRMTRRPSGSAPRSSPTTRSRPNRRAPTSTATPTRQMRFNVGRAYLNVTGQINHMIAVPRHARHRARNRVWQLARRQLHLPAEVRLRAVQHGRLDDARVLCAIRHAADPVGRLHGDASTATDSRARSSRIGSGYLSSSDVGATFRYNFAQNYGEVHAGFYNGENYNRRRDQRPEGVHDPRHGPPAADGISSDPRSARDRFLRPRRVRQERRATRGPCSR